MLQPRSRPVIWLLAFLNAVGSLSTDFYLPAWPAIQSALNTDIQHVQLTLSAYLVGFALCQLACGPLSDRYGRRPVLIGGLMVYLLGSLACAHAVTIQQLILFRVVQGVGACCGPTLSRAIVRDVYDGPQAAKVMGLMAVLMTLAPIVAPLIGGILVTHMPWGALFNLLALFVAVATLLVMVFLPETWPRERRNASYSTRDLPGHYATVLADLSYRRYSLSASFLYAGAMAFLSGASSVLMGVYGVPAATFGLYFAVMVLGFTGGSFINARIGDRMGSEYALPMGILMGVAAAVASLLVQLTFASTSTLAPFLFVLCMAAYSGGIGLAMPQAVAAAMQPFKQIAGTASALWGFMQMMIAAATGALVGWALNYNALALPAAMLGAAIVACACWFGLRAAPQPSQL